MKLYVKDLNNSGACFLYIAEKFTKLSNENVEEGTFVGPLIKQVE